MEIYLIRHAVAEKRALHRPDDGRALTADGRRRFRMVVKGLKAISINFDTLYHSPKLRATETADMLSGLVSGQTRVTALLAQSPGKELLAILKGRSIAVVGHEPWLSELASLLLLGEPRHAALIEIKKGGVVRLSGSATLRGTTLKALWPPRTFRSK